MSTILSVTLTPSARDIDSDVPQRVALLTCPCVVEGAVQLVVPEGSRRLVAFVALRGCRIERAVAAGTLWPDGSEERAAGNLRTSLWRLRRAGITVIDSDAGTLGIRTGVVSDVKQLVEWADRVIHGDGSAADMSVPPGLESAADLLPGWCEDWVTFEREAVRQLMLHALESLSRNLLERAQYADAIGAAMAAVRIEPLRESAHRSLALAHIAEGNFGEAMRVFRGYKERAREELGACPSSEFVRILEPLAPRGL